MSDKINIQDMIRQHKESQGQTEIKDTSKEAIIGGNENSLHLEAENVAEGQVVETKEVMDHAPIAGGGISGGAFNGKLSAEQLAGIEEELMEMDKEAQAAKAEFDAWNKYQKEQRDKGEKAEKFETIVGQKTIDEVKEQAEKAKEEASEKDEADEAAKARAEEALVIIDKSGMGNVINFTDEEREKLERVKKIKLQEVETIDLKTLKTKRAKKDENAETILKKINTIRTTNIVLPISGFTCVMQGCSTFELIGLVSSQDVTVEGLINKWSLIHSKVENTSLGKMDFNTFLNSVSQMEYEIFVYGILCATYPEEDIFPLNCPECKTDVEHKYLIRTLLQTQEMSQRLIDAVKKTVDSSYTLESSKECFENSLLNTSFVYELPVSKYIFKLGISTAHSHIHESMAAIDRLDQKYARAAILASTVDSVFIKDPSDGEYYEFDDIETIIKVIYTLDSVDLGVLGAKIGEIVEGMSFTFGLNDITCKNPKCNHHEEMVEVDLDTILFHKYQQAMNTTID